MSNTLNSKELEPIQLPALLVDSARFILKKKNQSDDLFSGDALGMKIKPLFELTVKKHIRELFSAEKMGVLQTFELLTRADWSELSPEILSNYFRCISRLFENTRFMLHSVQPELRAEALKEIKQHDVLPLHVLTKALTWLSQTKRLAQIQTDPSCDPISALKRCVYEAGSLLSMMGTSYHLNPQTEADVRVMYDNADNQIVPVVYSALFFDTASTDQEWHDNGQRLAYDLFLKMTSERDIFNPLSIGWGIKMWLNGRGGFIKQLKARFAKPEGPKEAEDEIRKLSALVYKATNTDLYGGIGNMWIMVERITWLLQSGVLDAGTENIQLTRQLRERVARLINAKNTYSDEPRPKQETDGEEKTSAPNPEAILALARIFILHVKTLSREHALTDADFLDAYHRRLLFEHITLIGDRDPEILSNLLGILLQNNGLKDDEGLFLVSPADLLTVVTTVYASSEHRKQAIGFLTTIFESEQRRVKYADTLKLAPDLMLYDWLHQNGTELDTLALAVLEEISSGDATFLLRVMKARMVYQQVLAVDFKRAQSELETAVDWLLQHGYVQHAQALVAKIRLEINEAELLPEDLLAED